MTGEPRSRSNITRSPAVVTRGSHTVAVDGLRVTAAWCGASWGVSCWEEDCRANIMGYRGQRAALTGAMAHLIWHVNRKPTCRDCGAWLAYRTSKRCRKGTCEADRG